MYFFDFYSPVNQSVQGTSVHFFTPSARVCIPFFSFFVFRFIRLHWWILLTNPKALLIHSTTECINIHTLTIKYSHFNSQKQVHIQTQHKRTCMCASMIDVTNPYCDHFYQLLLLGQILHSFPVLGSLNVQHWMFTFITGVLIVL